MPEPFNAHQFVIGYCENPACRAVHIQLLDKDDRSHAQAVIPCEEIEGVIADLRKARDYLLGSSVSLEKH